MKWVRCDMVGIKKDLEAFVDEMLLQLGFNEKLIGFMYIKFCIIYYIEQAAVSSKNLSLTKIVYPECAKYFNCTPESVERSIRFCIKQCWLYGNTENQSIMFSDCIGFNTFSPSTTLLFDRLIRCTICRGYAR